MKSMSGLFRKPWVGAFLAMVCLTPACAFLNQIFKSGESQPRVPSYCPENSISLPNGKCGLQTCAPLKEKQVDVHFAGNFKQGAGKVRISGVLHLDFLQPQDPGAWVKNMEGPPGLEPPPELPPEAYETGDLTAWRVRPDIGTVFQVSGGSHEGTLSWSDCIHNTHAYPPSETPPCRLDSFAPTSHVLKTAFLAGTGQPISVTLKIAQRQICLDGFASGCAPVIADAFDDIPNLPTTVERDCKQQEIPPLPPNENDPQISIEEDESVCSRPDHDVNSGKRVLPWHMYSI